MTARDAVKLAFDTARAAFGPLGVDFTPSQLTIRTRTWPGGEVGSEGEPTVDDLVLPQQYAIRTLKLREVASSGGKFQMGDVKVGPITPSFPATDFTAAGGYTVAELAPDGAAGVEIVYLLTGPIAGEYALEEIDASKPFGIELVIRRKRTTP